MAKRRVTLYTDGSGPFIRARKYLVGKEIQFEEVDATTPEGHARLLKSTRQARIPCIEVRGSGMHVSSGFDEFLYAVALDSTLSYDKFMEGKRKEQELAESNLGSQEQLRL
jgi:hypothetical protein